MRLKTKIGKILPNRLNAKPIEYSQQEYYCEWCNEVLQEETKFHKPKKMFLCTKCFLKANKNEI